MQYKYKIHKRDRVAIRCTNELFGWYKAEAPQGDAHPKLNEEVHVLYFLPCDCSGQFTPYAGEHPGLPFGAPMPDINGKPRRAEDIYKPFTGDKTAPLGSALNPIPAFSEGEHTMTEAEVDAQLKELEDWGLGAGILMRPQKPLFDVSPYIDRLDQLRKYIHFKIDHPEDLNRMSPRQRRDYIKGVLYHEDRLDMLRLTARDFEHYLSLYEQFQRI